MAGPKLVDMGRKPLKESLTTSNVGAQKPSPYTYEHKITLNSEDMGKLGVEEPQIGDVFHVMSEGHVQSVEQTERENGEKSHTVDIQLKRMAVKHQKEGQGSMLGAVDKGLKDSAADEGE